MAKLTKLADTRAQKIQILTKLANAWKEKIEKHETAWKEEEDKNKEKTEKQAQKMQTIRKTNEELQGALQKEKGKRTRANEEVQVIREKVVGLVQKNTELQHQYDQVQLRLTIMKACKKRLNMRVQAALIGLKMFRAQAVQKVVEQGLKVEDIEKEYKERKAKGESGVVAALLNAKKETMRKKNRKKGKPAVLGA